MKNRNLYNLTDGKTKATIEFISNLKERDYWKKPAQLHFREQIELALALPTANEMLDFIGYKPKGKCLLIEECDELDMETAK